MIADFTYVWTAEGWLYVAAVDLFSRRVVGRSMQSAMTAQLVTDAFSKAKVSLNISHSQRPPLHELCVAARKVV